MNLILAEPVSNNLEYGESWLGIFYSMDIIFDGMLHGING